MNALLVSKQYDKAATFAAEMIRSNVGYQADMGAIMRKQIELLRNDKLTTFAEAEEARQRLQALGQQG